MRVAIVEDCVQIQDRLGRLLCAIPGIDLVGCAANVSAARHLIETTLPDVVVLDVELEGGDTSLGVMRFIAREHPSIEAIILSNFTWGSLRAGFLAEGAKAYFDKSLEFLKARDWIADKQSRMGSMPARPPGIS
jgi:DNA-binding NarL/FixJ family response regulator